MTVASPIEPPELAHLVDFAERPRVHDWSLRSALVRYAQPEPQRVGAVLELVRRVEWALRPHAKRIERNGSELWDAVRDGSGPPGQPDAELIGLLRAAAELDRLGEVLAGWAVDPSSERPNAEVDAVTSDVARRLDALGVPREERARPVPQGRRPGAGRRSR